MTSHEPRHPATSNPSPANPQPPETAENDRANLDDIPDDVIDTVNTIFRYLAHHLATAGHAIETLGTTAADAAHHLIVAFIDLEPEVVDEHGEYWPDAHQVTFEPEPVETAKPRDRLQDWLDRSADVLEVDGSGYTRGGPPTVRSSPHGHHRTAAQQIAHRDRLVERGWPISQAWADAVMTHPFPEEDD